MTKGQFRRLGVVVSAIFFPVLWVFTWWGMMAYPDPDHAPWWILIGVPVGLLSFIGALMGVALFLFDRALTWYDRLPDDDDDYDDYGGYWS